MKFQLKNVEDLAGFSAQNFVGPGTVQIQIRGMATSDDTMFYRLVEQISAKFLATNGVPANDVSSFLVIIHADATADVHVNQVPCVVDIRPKRPISKGEVVTDKDIADMGKVVFDGIPVAKTDKVIYCFKIGWRFGLFFDFSYHATPTGASATSSSELNVERMQQDIGDIYRYLTFYHVYKSLETESQFASMLADGWFPFVEILTNDYKALSAAYHAKFDIEAKTTTLVGSFTKARIVQLTGKWWKNPAFADKEKLFTAGIDAFLRDTEEGNITCIKTLGSEIEGILRRIYHADTGIGDRVTSKQLIAHIIDKGKKSTSSEYSLLLPVPFLEYLETVIFASFSVANGNVPLSRNSSSHGVADAEQYTRARALQFILSLDQVFYFTK